MKRIPISAYVLIALGLILSNAFAYIGDEIDNNVIFSIVFTISFIMGIIGLVLTFRFYGPKSLAKIVIVDEYIVQLHFRTNWHRNSKEQEMLKSSLKANVHSNSLAVIKDNEIIAKVYKNQLCNSDDWEYIVKYFKPSH